MFKKSAKMQAAEWIIENHPDWYYEVPGMRFLVLGSFPPPPNDPHSNRISRHYEFYYPFKRNQFWTAFTEALDLPPLEHNEGLPAIVERKKIMRKFRIGFQNMGKTIRRKGRSSRDTDIVMVEFQDILKIILKNPTLKTILLVGYSSKSSTYFSFLDYLNHLKHEKNLNIHLENKNKKPAPRDIFYLKINQRKIKCVVLNSTSPLARIKRQELVQQFKFALGRKTTARS